MGMSLDPLNAVRVKLEIYIILIYTAVPPPKVIF